MSFTHLHLLLNHFPVIGTLLGIALLSIAVLRKSDELGKISLALFVLLAAISLVVYFTGEPAEAVVKKLPGFSRSITEEHEEFALFATIALGVFGALCLSVLSVFRRTTLPWRLTIFMLVFSIVAGSLMAYTGMLGGQIRHTEVRSNDLPVSAVR